MNISRFRLTTILQIVVLLASAIYNYDLFKGTKLYGNAASRILLAVGPLLGIGSPYKDLYEIVPPGYIFFIEQWVRMFGMSMVSFKFIQVFLVLLNGYFLILLCQKLFKSHLLQFFVFFSIIITVHSRIIQTDFFAIDFFATTLILGGLVALFHLRDPLFKISLAATLFTLASQMKDIYILSLVSLLPFYVREFLKRDKSDFYRLVILSAVGPLLIGLTLFLYLYFNDALIAYVHILRDKYGFAQTFSPKRIVFAYVHMTTLFEKTFLRFPYLIGGLFSANALILARLAKDNLPKKKKRYSSRALIKKSQKFITEQLNNYSESLPGQIVITIITMVCVLYGIAIYGLYSGSQLTMVVTSFYLLVGLLLILPLRWISQLKSGQVNIVFTLMLLATFFPAQSVFEYTYYPVRRDYSFEVEKVIQARVPKSECILHIHGWEIAPSYIYSQRKPCSRYFLTNELFNIKRTDIFVEYRDELLNNPAAAIIYSEKGADTDIPKFNDQIINMSKILKDCYTADPQFTEYKDHFFAAMTLYWPNADLTKEQLRSCWQRNID